MPANPHILCPDCKEGHHDPLQHSEMGCLQAIAPPPDDYVCACKVPTSRKWTDDLSETL